MDYYYQYNTGPQIIHNRRICYEPHLHRETEIIAMFRGKASIIADGSSYDAEAGDFIFIFPNTVHSYSSDNNVEVGKFIFDTESVPEISKFLENKRPETPIIKKEKAEAAGLHRLAREILSEYKTASPAVKKAYLMLLSGKMLEQCSVEDRTADSDMIRAILDYCSKNYRQNLTLETTADALFISRSYLSHIFCEKIKINFRDYINMLRINEACVLLGNGGITATGAAEKSGFGSIRSFNRAFLKHRGMSPRDYIRQQNQH